MALALVASVILAIIGWVGLEVTQAAWVLLAFSALLFLAFLGGLVWHSMCAAPSRGYVPEGH